MDESGDFWRSVTTEMAVRHNKCELAPPVAFQSVLAVAAAVMQRGTPQKKKSLTGKSGKAQPVPPTGIEPVRCFHRGILSPLRLPVPPRRLTVWYCSAKRGNCQSAKPCRPECKKANGLFAANGKAARFMWQCTRYFRAIPHNSKCRYGERGAADAKPKAQIILDAAKVSAASGGNSEPKQGQRSQSARGFCPRSTMRVPQPDIIEHFGNADAVPQLPERCLSRKAGIVRCCLICDVFFVSAHITHLSYRAVRRRRHGESCNAAGNAGTSEKRCSRSEGMPRR